MNAFNIFYSHPQTLYQIVNRLTTIPSAYCLFASIIYTRWQHFASGVYTAFRIELMWMTAVLIFRVQQNVIPEKFTLIQIALKMHEIDIFWQADSSSKWCYLSLYRFKQKYEGISRARLNIIMSERPAHDPIQFGYSLSEHKKEGFKSFFFADCQQVQETLWAKLFGQLPHIRNVAKRRQNLTDNGIILARALYLIGKITKL